MVFYYTAIDGSVIYVGKDKYENEELLEHAWPEDVWFHVDDLSSAHVYLRLGRGQGVDDISPEVLEDCCQLVKANSIEGSKRSSVRIIYTMWTNLRKTTDMDVGQVGYKNKGHCRYHTVEKRDRTRLSRLKRTREERHPDLRQERRDRDARVERKEKSKRKNARKEAEAARSKEIAEQKRLQELRSYKGFFDHGDEVADETGVGVDEDILGDSKPARGGGGSGARALGEDELDDFMGGGDDDDSAGVPFGDDGTLDDFL